MTDLNTTLNFPAPNFTGDGMSGLVTYVNTVTNNLFGASILFMVYSIAFLSLKNYSVIHANMAASFITLMVTLALWVSQLVPAYYITIIMVMFLISVLMLAVKGGK
tara:strand:- start:43 stop:360 length:318 start_codon:yes stop_codon:yes gene_type:complete